MTAASLTRLAEEAIAAALAECASGTAAIRMAGLRAALAAAPQLLLPMGLHLKLCFTAISTTQSKVLWLPVGTPRRDKLAELRIKLKLGIGAGARAHRPRLAKLIIPRSGVSPPPQTLSDCIGFLDALADPETVDSVSGATPWPTSLMPTMDEIMQCLDVVAKTQSDTLCVERARIAMLADLAPADGIRTKATGGHQIDLHCEWLPRAGAMTLRPRFADLVTGGTFWESLANHLLANTQTVASALEESESDSFDRQPRRGNSVSAHNRADDLVRGAIAHGQLTCLRLREGAAWDTDLIIARSGTDAHAFVVELDVDEYPDLRLRRSRDWRLVGRSTNSNAWEATGHWADLNLVRTRIIGMHALLMNWRGGP